MAAYAAPQNRSRLRDASHAFVAAAANRIRLRRGNAAAFEQCSGAGPKNKLVLGATSARLRPGEPKLAALVRDRQDLHAQAGSLAGTPNSPRGFRASLARTRAKPLRAAEATSLLSPGAATGDRLQIPATRKPRGTLEILGRNFQYCHHSPELRFPAGVDRAPKQPELRHRPRNANFNLIIEIQRCRIEFLDNRQTERWKAATGLVPFSRRWHNTASRHMAICLMAGQ